MFFAQAQGAITLDLYQTHLIRGSWAEVMDLLEAQGFPLDALGALASSLEAE